MTLLVVLFEAAVLPLSVSFGLGTAGSASGGGGTGLALMALGYATHASFVADIALNENVRTVGNWLANNVDPAIAKTRSEAQDLPAWYAAVEPPP